MSPTAIFFDAERHFEALALLASSHLFNGNPSAAFAFADRRCRIVGPGAHEFRLRAEASRLTGHAEYAEADLAAALERDPTEDTLNYCALKWGAHTERARAAERLISSGNASFEILAQALETVMRGGLPVAHSLRPKGRDVEGWIAWRGTDPLEIRTDSPAGSEVHLLERDDAHPLASEGVSAASVSWPGGVETLRSVDLALHGRIVARAPAPWYKPPRSDPIVLRKDVGGSSSPFVDVVVPVYEDLESTRACLNSLIEQKSEIPLRIIVVDDRSPNRELAAFVEMTAERHDVLLIRNACNLGFAGSVNAALAHCVAGDVLLLNSDTLLPAGAIDRLAAAAHSATDIGTVTPFSNNGELTSYPRPDAANPIESAASVLEIDRCAARANGAAVVDVPNGVGFCLYIKRSCLDSVGALSEVYSRGYYEDVEFCLKARERGFRNVCATGVFVGHVGTRSFGSEKRALVVRNRAVLGSRFPEYRVRYAAFVEADPLKSARAAIDELVAPGREAIVLASGQGSSKLLAQMRMATLSGGEWRTPIIHAAVQRAGDRVDFAGEGSGAPHSLTFSLRDASGMAALRGYLARLRVVRVELFDASALPEPFLTELLALGTRIEVVCGDLEWFRSPLACFEGSCRAAELARACDECSANLLENSARPDDPSDRRARLNLALGHADAITPIDRMGEAFSRRIFNERAAALDRDGEVERRSATGRSGGSLALGLLAPLPAAAVDRFVLRLGRLFALTGIETPIVVLGRCIDDLGLMAAGNVFVTGPAKESEYERLVAQYEIGALVSPYRTAFFGPLDRLAQITRTPKAYFDWSFGALAVDTDDLALDPRICEEKAASFLASWVRALYREDR